MEKIFKEILYTLLPIVIIVVLIVAFITAFFAGLKKSEGYNSDSSDGQDISTSTNILFDFIASWENSALLKYMRSDSTDGYNDNVYIYKCVTEDKKYYKCVEDINMNNGTRNFGFGICHYYYEPSQGKFVFNHVEHYKSEGIDICEDKYLVEGTLIDIDIVDRVKVKTIEEKLDYVKNITQGLDLKEHQLHALVDISFQRGNIDGFVSAYKTYGNTDKLRTSSFTAFNDSVVGPNRSNARWELFHNGIYNSGTGEVLDPNDYTIPSSGGNTDNPYYDIKLYNSDGSVNKEAITKLESVETDFVNAGDGYRNGLQRLQCTWWANGRASQYLAQFGTKYKKYPTTTGNGGDYWQNNINGGWFKYGTTPRPNSILCYAASPTMGGWGHVTYVEAVDPVNKKVYISHASSGERWNGIDELDWDGTLWGAKPQGYIYLDEPL